MAQINDEAKRVELTCRDEVNPLFWKEAFYQEETGLPLIVTPAGIYSAYNVGAIEVKRGRLFKKLFAVLAGNDPDWVSLSRGNGDVSWKIDNVLTLVFIRVEGRDGKSRIYAAVSRNGVTGWVVYRFPLLQPDKDDDGDYGYEDPRIHYIPGQGYIVTVVHYINWEFGPSYETEVRKLKIDTFELEYRGTVGQDHSRIPNKDTVLFSERIDGKQGALCRPEIGGEHKIIYATSPDLGHLDWGQDKKVLDTGNEPWNFRKVGMNGPPIWLPPGFDPRLPSGGWLVSYHTSGGGKEYYMGFMILHPTKPWVVTHRPKVWFFGPEAGHSSAIGGYPGVVFSCGHVWHEGEDMLYIYTTIGDRQTWLYTLSMSKLVAYILQFPAKQRERS